MSFAVAAIALAAPFSGVPATPPLVVDSYRVVAQPRQGSADRSTVKAPDRFRIRSVFGRDTFLDIGRGGTERIAQTSQGDGSLFRKQFTAQPDGFPRTGVERYESFVAYVLGQARGGTLTLTTVRLAGKAALRTQVDLPANDCAGLPSRTARVWLSQRTFLPLRVVERATSNGRIVDSTNYTYRLINAPLPAKTFAPPPVGRHPFRTNDHFTRTSPAAAAGPLPYTPRVPAVLPDGFALATSGWAPRSGHTGAEGSIAPFSWLFAATYRRGQERIEVTQRASKKDWPDDPFGGECQPLQTEPVTVNGIAATYGTGQSTVPHIFWRDGSLLYTVSGPYPRDDLLAIAASLHKVGA
jgi:hypothetical protein